MLDLWRGLTTARRSKQGWGAGSAGGPYIGSMQRDTSQEAARLRLAVLRGLGGEARLAQALELSEAVRLLAEEGRRDREAGTGTARKERDTD